MKTVLCGKVAGSNPARLFPIYLGALSLPHIPLFPCSPSRLVYQAFSVYSYGKVGATQGGPLFSGDNLNWSAWPSITQALLSKLARKLLNTRLASSRHLSVDSSNVENKGFLTWQKIHSPENGK